MYKEHIVDWYLLFHSVSPSRRICTQHVCTSAHIHAAARWLILMRAFAYLHVLFSGGSGLPMKGDSGGVVVVCVCAFAHRRIQRDEINAIFK